MRKKKVRTSAKQLRKKTTTVPPVAKKITKASKDASKGKKADTGEPRDTGAKRPSGLGAAAKVLAEAGDS